MLLSYSGEVKLTDFGLATSTLKLEKTAPGVVYGKVSYMAPEQARGELLDSRTDLYSAAIILWELLTGRQLLLPPQARGGDDPQDDLLERVRHPQIIPPSQQASRVPHDLDIFSAKRSGKSRRSLPKRRRVPHRAGGISRRKCAGDGWPPGRALFA